MYQALYRKYRPHNFDEIVGQDVIVKTLKNVIKKENLTHAYLFAGPRGTGKTSIAKILAKTINCQDPKDGISCEKCVSCTQINDKQSIDIIEIDAASNNGVDEIRELKSKVNLVPTTSKYKVYIIDEVHMLTTGAFNALLKTLEEPPVHIIFILATTEPHKIPSTILSRCQRFDFKRISDSALIERIKIVCENEQIAIEEEAIGEIARISDGGMRDALSLLDQVTAYCENTITSEDVHTINGSLTQSQLKEFIKTIIERNLTEIFKLIDVWNENGKNFSKILEELILYLKNIIIAKYSPDYLKNQGLDIESYNDLNIGKKEILKNIDILNKSLVEVKKSNMPKTVFEITILHLLDDPASEQLFEKKTVYLEKVLNEPIKPETLVEDKSKKTAIEIKSERVIDESLKNKIDEIKNIRINNTLATFDKKELIRVQNLQENLKSLLINPDYSQEVSIVLDGVLKAAGDGYLIYVFENEANAALFNQNLIRIEEILEQEFRKKYKVISTDIISWEIIKTEFNSKTKKYEYVEEKKSLSDLFENKQEQNEIENLFSNEIEYS
ncbi:MAG: DNA polymerase III subunit gamma/tau [Firmicutes bacterium]|nr:DNA polymerase III subunit gamma/tau [Bacillota bacterium]